MQDSKNQNKTLTKFYFIKIKILKIIFIIHKVIYGENNDIVVINTKNWKRQAIDRLTAKPP